MEDLLGTNINASELWDQALSLIMTYAPKVVLAIITLVLGLWLINRFISVLDKKLGAKDPTLNKFLCGLISAIFKVMLLISVASMIGIATTSFIAVIGAAGLAGAAGIGGQPVWYAPQHHARQYKERSQLTQNGRDGFRCGHGEYLTQWTSGRAQGGVPTARFWWRLYLSHRVGPA